MKPKSQRCSRCHRSGKYIHPFYEGKMICVFHMEQIHSGRHYGLILEEAQGSNGMKWLRIPETGNNALDALILAEMKSDKSFSEKLDALNLP